MKLTREQREAIHRKYLQSSDHAKSYLSFRRRVKPALDGSVMMRWCGMWLGIEEDGYTHS